MMSDCAVKLRKIFFLKKHVEKDVSVCFCVFGVGEVKADAVLADAAELLVWKGGSGSMCVKCELSISITITTNDKFTNLCPN